jgi:predicted dehydrogenase
MVGWPKGRCDRMRSNAGGQDPATQRRLRVGVVGTGLIAQVMHLHYLTELADRFEIAAVCDVVEGNARACGERYGAGMVFSDWREMLAEPLDAVLVLTSGSHAPIAIAAAEAGMAVLVEKPMCFSSAEGAEMVAAADRAGVTLMVSYPKRYEPAFQRFRDEAGQLEGARLLRVTTLESPFRPYLGHYPLLSPLPVPPELASRLSEEAATAVAAALGPEASDFDRRIYATVLLDTLVHELNTVRGLLGEPDRIDHVQLSEQAVTVLLRFGDLPVVIHWIDLPGIARYEMEFALFAPDRRVTLSFPSPFLRNEPCTLTVEAGEPGTTRSWRTDETVSYVSGFRRELEEFHHSVVTGTPSATPGRDGLADVALCEAIIECHRTGRPVHRPTDAGPGGRAAAWRIDHEQGEYGPEMAARDGLDRECAGQLRGLRGNGRP